MRIPKRVNAAWDWVESHGRIVAVIFLMVVLAAGLLWLPVLAALALGAAGGGLIVYQRLAKRLAKVRDEVDDLLRETGALRHRNTVLASGVVASETLMTQKLMTIPEEDFPEEDAPQEDIVPFSEDSSSEDSTEDATKTATQTLVEEERRSA